MDTVWVVTGKKITEAQPASFYDSAYIARKDLEVSSLYVRTSSGDVRIPPGRWFKTKRAAQLALARKRK